MEVCSALKVVTDGRVVATAVVAGIVSLADGARIVALRSQALRALSGRGGMVSVADIFAFLNAWFAGNPQADINGGGLAVQDIFDFLNLWFAGC